MTLIFPNENIRTLYNTFRNKLRQLELVDTLYVLWAYMNFLQFKTPFPVDIEVQNSFLFNPYSSIMIPDWSLIFITQEALLHCDFPTNHKKSIKKWHTFSSLVNSLNLLNNEIAGTFVDSDNIKSEIFRMAHQQFPLQSKANTQKSARYFKIFGNKRLEPIFISKFRLDIKKFYAISYLSLGAFINGPIIKLPVDTSKVGITNSEIDKFYKIVSIQKSELIKKISTDRVLNERFEYSLFPIFETPIIKMQFEYSECLVCPSTRLFFDKFTSGIYYDLFNEPGFKEAWGPSFEDYVKNVIEEINKKNEWLIFNDSKDRKANTSDWVICSNDVVVFIECKTKRLTMDSKIILGPNPKLENDKTILAEAISQAYGALQRYLQGDYPRVEYQEGLAPFIIIATLEDWYSWIFTDRGFNEKVKQFLINKGLSSDLMEKYPYFVCSIEEVEKLLQVSKVHGFYEVFTNKITNIDFKTCAMNIFLDDFYRNTVEGLEPLFPYFFDEVDALVENKSSM